MHRAAANRGVVVAPTPRAAAPAPPAPTPFAAARRALGAGLAAAGLSALLASGACALAMMRGRRIGECGTERAPTTALFSLGAAARLEGVNKPELLPPAYTPVIDVAGFLTDGEEARVKRIVESLEADTGLKLRVLAQNYPGMSGREGVGCGLGWSVSWGGQTAPRCPR